MEAGRRYRTDYALCARFGGQAPVRALAAQAILATPEQKVQAYRATYSVIVDLESGAVARVAARHGLPFAAVRAVCDPAGFALPPLALEALDAVVASAPGASCAPCCAGPARSRPLSRCPATPRRRVRHWRA